MKNNNSAAFDRCIDLIAQYIEKYADELEKEIKVGTNK